MDTMMLKTDAPTSSLREFLSPRSIAVVGATAEAAKIPGICFRHLLNSGYPGRLYPINPKYDELEGLTCLPSIIAVGAPIDLAVVAVPPGLVMKVLEECVAAGVKSAVIITSGFAEAGGEHVAVQEKIAALARSSGMRICGPNSNGFYNADENINANFSPALRPGASDKWPAPLPRRAGVVGQSGGLSFAFLDHGRPYGLDFSFIINAANEADLTLSEFFAYLVEDAGTDVIILFIEGIRDPDRFVAAARAAALKRKPVIVCKIGRSQAAARATASHTANMAGWGAAYKAVFKKYGIVTASDPEEAATLAAAFASNPPAKGDRVGVITVSGGTGALASDALEDWGLVVPEFSPGLQLKLDASVSNIGSTHNPVDVTAGTGTGRQNGPIDLINESDEVDILFIVNSLANEKRVSLDLEVVKGLTSRRHKPALFYTYTLPSFFAVNALAGAGAYVNVHLTWAAKGARALVDAGRFPQPDEERYVFPASDTIGAALPATGALGEYDAKLLLETAGVGKPTQRLVKDKTALLSAAQALGWPLAMKIQSPDILHKTEVGGVALNLGSAEALTAAYDAMLGSVAAHAPDAKIDGVLLQPMAPKGVEILVGVVRDPVFGPIVTVGAGGVTAELFKDISYAPAPVSAREARAMLAELKTYPLLTGYRGAPAADIDALAQIIRKVSHLAANFPAIREIELNPVLVHPDGEGCTIIDALVLTGPDDA